MARVPTGIPGFDELIEGGFIENDVILLTGGPGAGKSTFGSQYLYYGRITSYNVCYTKLLRCVRKCGLPGESRSNRSAEKEWAKRERRDRLEERVEETWGTLRKCRLCPRECRADRMGGETGFCGAGAAAKVAAVTVHDGEEPPISGTRGSGTVFFSP